MSKIIKRTENTITKQLFCDLFVVTVYRWEAEIRRFSDHFFQTKAEAIAFVGEVTL